MVAHLLLEQVVGGSNPLAPTNYKKSDPNKDRSFVLLSGLGLFSEWSIRDGASP